MILTDEICIEGVDGLVAAQSAGANRGELCAVWATIAALRAGVWL
jgi:copper homeostasis protein CutC